MTKANKGIVSASTLGSLMLFLTLGTVACTPSLLKSEVATGTITSVSYSNTLGGDYTEVVLKELNTSTSTIIAFEDATTKFQPYLNKRVKVSTKIYSLRKPAEIKIEEIK